MALLVDALNKADQERRVNMELSLEDDDKATEATEHTAKSSVAAQPNPAPVNQQTTPPKSHFIAAPPPQKKSFAGAIVLVTLILFFIVAGGIYWWVIPTSGLLVNADANNTSNKKITNTANLSKKTNQQDSVFPNYSDYANDTLNNSKNNPARQSKINQLAPKDPAATDLITDNHITKTLTAVSEPSSLPKTSSIAVKKPYVATKLKQRKNATTLRKRTSTKRTATLSPLAKALKLIEQRHYREAQSIYQRLLKKNPNNIEALQNMGVIAYNTGRIDSAQKWMQKLLKIRPSHAFALQFIEATSPDNNGSSVAVGSESQNSDSGANTARKHFIQGNQMASQGLWVEAQNQFFLSWRDQSEHPDYAYNLAVALDQLGNGQLALKYYQQAIANSRLANAPNFQFSVPTARRRIIELLGNSPPAN